MGYIPGILSGKVILSLPNLVHGVLAREEGLAGDHLCQDAAQAPHVDPLRVVLLPQEDLRRPVPPCRHVVREAAVGQVHL